MFAIALGAIAGSAAAVVMRIQFAMTRQFHQLFARQSAIFGFQFIPKALKGNRRRYPCGHAGNIRSRVKAETCR